MVILKIHMHTKGFAHFSMLLKFEFNLFYHSYSIILLLELVLSILSCKQEHIWIIWVHFVLIRLAFLAFLDLLFEHFSTLVRVHIDVLFLQYTCILDTCIRHLHLYLHDVTRWHSMHVHDLKLFGLFICMNIFCWDVCKYLI